MYGHKFIQQQFYNIMRCALCGELLKYSAGMQCSDCKYTCHKKCYQKVVTKCISKSNAETDPDEEKLNHRIPHRFEPTTNLGANWCCHCGYMLPVGKKTARKCSGKLWRYRPVRLKILTWTECGLTCHAHCMHLVPDFCGMSMEVANTILGELRATKHRKQPMTERMRPPPSEINRPAGEGQSAAQERHSYTTPYPLSPAAKAGANVAYGNAAVPSSPQAQQYPVQPYTPPPPPPRVDSAAELAAKAAHAALQQQRPGSGGYGQSPPYPYYPQPGAIQSGAAQSSAMPPPPASGYPPKNVQVLPVGQQPPPQSNAQYQPAVQPDLYPAKDSYSPKDPYPPKAVVPAQPQNVQSPVAAPPARHQKIGLDHFNFLAVLGKGNFGKVMLAETKASKQLYAIKVLKKEFIIENDEVESTRSEKRVFLIANKERHPFLLSLHACFQTETRVYFVMEYISGGDLMLHIQRGQFGSKRAQ
jgi:hypothetical protein